MQKFNLVFDGISKVVEAEDLKGAKKSFARELIDTGKTDLRNFIIIMNKITVEEGNSMNVVTPVTPVVDVVDVVDVAQAPAMKRVGRPVNPNSARQIKMAERQALLDSGVIFKRGRKVDHNSANQKRLTARQALLDAGITPKRGRPVNPNSARQIKMATKVVTVS